MFLFRQSFKPCHWAIAFILLVLVAGCSFTPSPTLSPTPPTPSAIASSPTTSAKKEDIWSLLQQEEPGYVVMMRHAIAPGTGDPANFRVEDCTTQRNLSAEGRTQAVRMGEAFRRRNIRVARILSSQWCRCWETARLMNLGTVEAFPAINSFLSDRLTEPRQTAQLRQFIVDNRSTPGVIVLVTHQVNITAIADLVPQSGESVVLRANQQNQQVELVGQINAP